MTTLKEMTDKARYFSQWHQLCRIASHPAEPIVYTLESGTVTIACEHCGESKVLSDRQEPEYPKWSFR